MIARDAKVAPSLVTYLIGITSDLEYIELYEDSFSLSITYEDLIIMFTYVPHDEEVSINLNRLMNKDLIKGSKPFFIF
jgi:hypothetical protein